MKKMVTLAMLVLSIGAFAQTTIKSNEKSENRVSSELKDFKKDAKKHKKGKHGYRDAFKNLDLTDSQKAQLDEIKSESSSKKQKRSLDEKKEFKANRDEKIKSILTSEQYSKYLANKEVKKNK